MSQDENIVTEDEVTQNEVTGTISAPVITSPTFGSQLESTFTVTLGTFTITDSEETHVSTTYAIKDPDGVIIASSANDTENLDSYTFVDVYGEEDKLYTLSVLYKSETLISNTTKASGLKLAVEEVVDPDGGDTTDPDPENPDGGNTPDPDPDVTDPDPDDDTTEEDEPLSPIGEIMIKEHINNYLNYINNTKVVLAKQSIKYFSNIVSYAINNQNDKTVLTQCYNFFKEYRSSALVPQKALIGIEHLKPANKEKVQTVYTLFYTVTGEAPVSLDIDKILKLIPNEQSLILFIESKIPTVE